MIKNEEKDTLLRSWAFNVIDEFKGLTAEEVKIETQKRTLPFGLLIANVIQDFNLSSIIRSANAFGVETVYYFGKKKFDRRGTCGTHHYTNIVFLDSEDAILKLKEEYTFVCLENVPPCQSIYNFDWKTEKKPLIIIGEESVGIDQNIMNLADVRVEIPCRGSVRSINACAAASIAMSNFCQNFLSNI